MTPLVDLDAAAVAALVDEHHGAMRRLARLVGGGSDSVEALRRAWAAALADPAAQPAGASVRGWLLGLVLDELAMPPPPAEAPPLAPPGEFEDPDGRWAGWWRDGLQATPRPEHAAVEEALAAVPAALAAMLVLRDVEGLGPEETAAVTGEPAARQLELLHHGRVAVRSELRAGPGTAP
jgi:DNA-directed RNA polymerase specialized sigma24 family protein